MIKMDNPEDNITSRTYPRTLQEAFPRAPDWRKTEMDEEDYLVTVWGLAILGFVLIMGWWFP